MILALSTLSSAQIQFEPANVDMDVELIPSEQLMKVHLTLELADSFVQGGRVSFGIGEDFQITKAYFDPNTLLEITQKDGAVTIRIESIKGQAQNRLHIEYEGHPHSTSGRIAYVGKDGCYFSWLGGWMPFFAGTSGFVGNTTIKVPEGMVAASQGKFVGMESDGGSSLFRFKVERPCYYSIMAAPYEMHTKVVDGIEYRTYFLGGGVAKSEFYMSAVSRIIKAISSQLAAYPYDYICVIEAPDIEGLRIIGSSEQGMISLGSMNIQDDYINFPVIAHELGHMWFGNWVIGDTYAMSEALAQLAHFLASETIYGEEIMHKELLYGSPDHFSSLHLYLTMFADSNEDEPDMQVMRYDYKDYLVLQGKGPLVFLMLRDIIGKEAFTQGFSSAVKKYAHTRMTMDQLKEELEETSRQDLDWFFNQWVYKPGAPHLDLSWVSSTSGDGYLVKGKITQTKEPYYSMPIEVVLSSKEGKFSHMVNLRGSETPFTIPTDYQPNEVVLDPCRKSLWFGPDDRGKADFSNAMSFQAGPKEGVDLLRKYHAMNEDDLLATAWLAKYLLKTDSQSTEAFSLLDDLVRNIKPHGELEIYYPWACYELAKMYAENGNKDKAIELLRNLIALDRTKRYENQANNLLKDLIGQ
jgi:tetratricopeptide (TPR) repeat protein